MDKKLNNIRIIFWSIMFIGAIISFIFINKSEKSSRHEMLDAIQLLEVKVFEKAYTLGQADAMKGNIKIQKINDSTYVWLKSPWGKMKPSTDTIKVK